MHTEKAKNYKYRHILLIYYINDTIYVVKNVFENTLIYCAISNNKRTSKHYCYISKRYALI